MRRRAPAEVVERIVERVVTVKEPVRQKLPRSRTSRTFEFRVADCKGFVTVGEYEDGRPGEIFIRISKQGSTLAGIMDAFAISVSYGLQYGVPLRAYVETLTNTRFEPAGMTDDPDIRFASSLVDYIFRRLAVEYLTYEERAELGILTIGERTQPTLPGVEETAVETRQGSDVVADPPSIESAATLLDLAGTAPAPVEPPPGERTTPRRCATATPRCACSAASRCSGPAPATPAPAAATPPAAADGRTEGRPARRRPTAERRRQGVADSASIAANSSGEVTAGMWPLSSSTTRGR